MSNVTTKGDRNMLVRFALLIAAAAIASCSTDADVASRNLSQAADQFEISRRVVFYNGITGEYMLSIQGLCSLGKGQSLDAVTVTCKTAPGQYRKHYLGLSDNVTYFAEQLDSANVSTQRYRVIFKPSTIIPDVDLK